MDVNEIFFYGHNKYGQAGTGQQQHNKKYSIPKQIVFKQFIKQVSCGNHHSAILTIDGLIYTMGSNIHGTLGLGNSCQGGNINYAFRPTLIKDIKDVDQVVSGSYHMCAVREGELFTWGKGIDGQLGHGNMKNVFAPMKVMALGNDVESVSCGLNHTLVLVCDKNRNNNNNMNNFNGWGFGSGIYGQLGCGTNRSYNYPINIKLPSIQSISAGENHSLFITQNKLYGCGDNSLLQLGQLSEMYKNKKYILQPVRLLLDNVFLTGKQQQQSSPISLSGQVSLIDCHNLSVCLYDDDDMNNSNSMQRMLIWGGKLRIWPPVEIIQKQIINFKVSNQKVYYINGNNELVSLTFPQFDSSNNNNNNNSNENNIIYNNNPRQPIKQVILVNKNVLDLDCGENHLLAVGDIVAQTEQKINSSILSQWVGESLTKSKKSFSQHNINHNKSVNTNCNNYSKKYGVMNTYLQQQQHKYTPNQENKFNPLNEQMSEFYFTMHLKSGMSESIKSQQQQQHIKQQQQQHKQNHNINNNINHYNHQQWQSIHSKSPQWQHNLLQRQDPATSSTQTFKTFQNISSSIQIESRFPIDVNESDTKNAFVQEQFIMKMKNKQPRQSPSSQYSRINNHNVKELNIFTKQNTITEPQTIKFSQNRLQKLMQQMQLKTMHLKKNYPILNNNSGLRYQKKLITKTPSSYIKKQPQKFVMGSEQFGQGSERYNMGLQYSYNHQEPKISQFDDKLPIGLVLQQKNDLQQKTYSNIAKQNKQFKQQIMKKNISKQSILSSYHENNQCQKQQIIIQKKDKNNDRVNQMKHQKQDQQSIETIFMQLLRKQKQRASQDILSQMNNQKQPIQDGHQLLPQRTRKSLSHSCISSAKHTQPSTSRIVEKQSQVEKLQSQLYTANDRSPIQQHKLTTSKISQHSNISSKTNNIKKNSQILQISRSNRQLRYQLRDRNLKVSQLQEQLSKKQIEMQMLYSQLEYFRNMPVVCDKCGNQTCLQDPFFSN